MRKLLQKPRERTRQSIVDEIAASIEAALEKISDTTPSFGEYERALLEASNEALGRVSENRL